ncbi:hypothetical protein HDV00_012502 [Rhizophlyctis rosea]|nr:hypothetical protein HDV00_012502 [Rhizophlyctis rosea]
MFTSFRPGGSSQLRRTTFIIIGVTIVLLTFLTFTSIIPIFNQTQVHPQQATSYPEQLEQNTISSKTLNPAPVQHSPATQPTQHTQPRPSQPSHPKLPSRPQSSTNPLHLIPQPAYQKLHNGSFTISSQTRVVFSHSSVYGVARLLRDDLDLHVPPVPTRTRMGDHVRDNTIVLELLDGNDEKEREETLEVPFRQEVESYLLDITTTQIILRARTLQGLRYAATSLVQIVDGSISTDLDMNVIPCATILDAPRTGWRGFLLDTSRSFYTVDFLLRLMDVLAYHKLNVFHWHLANDQGWRIQIRKYHNLTDIGSWRAESSPKKKEEEDDDVEERREPYGGFYTQDEIRLIVTHAHTLGITMIPEITMPGHAMSLLSSYPHLGCTQGPYFVPSRRGIYIDNLCAGRESTFEFVENVLREVADLFPGRYIHLGGDEVWPTKWEKCGECRRRMREEGLAGVPELQSYFMHRVNTFVESLNKTPINWNDIIKGGADRLTSGGMIQNWNNRTLTKEAAKRGHFIIDSDGVYFDYPVRQQRNKTHDIHHFAGSLNLKQVYQWDPLKKLTKEEAKMWMGAEACLWTERAGQHGAYRKIFPRLSAFATNLWIPTKSANLSTLNDLLATVPKQRWPSKIETSAGPAPFPEFQDIVNGVHKERLERRFNMVGLGDGMTFDSSALDIPVSSSGMVRIDVLARADICTLKVQELQQRIHLLPDPSPRDSFIIHLIHLKTSKMSNSVDTIGGLAKKRHATHFPARTMVQSKYFQSISSAIIFYIRNSKVDSAATRKASDPDTKTLPGKWDPAADHHLHAQHYRYVLHFLNQSKSTINSIIECNKGMHALLNHPEARAVIEKRQKKRDIGGVVGGVGTLLEETAISVVDSVLGLFPKDDNVKGLKRFPEADYPFKAPGPTDQRGPCPDLNTLANHGYLPCNDMATFGQIVAATQRVLNMAADLANLLAVGGAIDGGDILSQKMSIGGADNRVGLLDGALNPVFGTPSGITGHGKFNEGDASATRYDFYLNKGDNFSFQPDLFKQMHQTALKVGNGTYNVDTIKEHFKNRYAASQAANE